MSLVHSIPLLIIAWRRPHFVRQVIDAIRPVAPQRVFVACDGPNPERPGEAEKVAATRQVIEQEIDWPCTIEHLYSDVNQGCRLGPSRAITWFFEQVEEGIILEDDCVPHPDFLRFCDQLLLKYRHEPRVWAINGNNFGADQRLYRHKPWAFVSLPQAWGWATWRDRWAMATDGTFCKIDQVIPSVNLSLFQQSSKAWRLSSFARKKKLADIEEVASGYDTWDFLWQGVVLSHGGLCVSPAQNLVSNVGDDVDGTHIRMPDARTHLATSPLSFDPGVAPRLHLNRQLNSTYERSMRLANPVPSFSTRLLRRLSSIVRSGSR